MMFKKILIANRGEIAVRIIRAARELGISSVAVFSECDRTALHVLMADEAYFLGPSPASESYLNIPRVIQIAMSCGAESIHPGYGFLAENPELAKQCQENLITFIGPSAKTMEQIGEKIAARRTAIQAKVPVVPGTESPLKSDEEAKAVAERIGLPIVLKAAAGGGGIGMRLVQRNAELSSAFRETQSEARAAFGESEVYIEKYLISPRHIEFQILADHYGNVIHLGERECSIQRRHQKLVEECPSPVVTSELRAAMGEAAVRLTVACGYQNAGTIEFLVDSEGRFYFLEMNTRLQVEHPITEMVTGLDIVKEQIRIASGEPLGYKQSDIHPRGSAIECRVYAEDPENQFFPSPGKISYLRVPGGPGVRDDTGIYEGWTVPIFYDSLLSKLVTWGINRDEAIQRMRRALSEYQVGGIKTTIPFFQSLVRHNEFLSGNLSTDFLSKHYSSGKLPADRESQREVAALVAALYSSGKKNLKSNQFAGGESPWKLCGRLNLLGKQVR
jgi:acetyl-CoA carboxylase biotin carboxylase subunit